MKVLLTGAFGNVGFCTLQELLRQGHSVRCLDLKSARNEQKAQQVEGKTEVVWGDVRQYEEVLAAVSGQEVIIHMAFIIPPFTDQDLEKALAVNVGGTQHIIEAAKSQATPPKLFFASTFDVYGHTQDQEPPRTVNDPVQATDDYSKHKIVCEELVRNSGLDWAIFRFCDMPPLIPPKPQPIMFEIPLNQRFEMLHPYDAALAIVNGIGSPIWGKIWLIGGGSHNQIHYRDYLETMLVSMGVGKLPEAAFTTKPYCTDWLDSSESQSLLHYQRYTYEEIIRNLAKAADPGPLVRFIMPLIRPLVRRSILKMSPYLHK